MAAQDRFEIFDFTVNTGTPVADDSILYSVNLFSPVQASLKMARTANNSSAWEYSYNPTQGSLASPVQGTRQSDRQVEDVEQELPRQMDRGIDL
jgi:hypothetical protein